MPGHIHPSPLVLVILKLISHRFPCALALLLFSLPFHSGLAQHSLSKHHPKTEQIDSLKRLLSSLRDSSRVDALNQLSSMYCKFLNWEFVYKQTDSARRYALQAGREAKQINYFKGQAVSMVRLGENELERDNINNAESYFRKAIPMFKKLNLLNELNWAHVQLGWILSLQCRFTESRNQLEVALAYARSVSDRLLESAVMRVTANSYLWQGYYLKAFEYNQKDYLISKTVDDARGLHPLTVLGPLYLIAGDTSEAIRYIQMSLQYAKAKGLKRAYLEELSSLYSLKKQYDSLLIVKEQFHQLRQPYDDDDIVLQKKWLMYGAVARANHYIKMGKYDKAGSLLPPPLDYFTRRNDVNEVLEILLLLTRVYEAERNDEKALHYGRQLLNLAEKSGTRIYQREGYGLLWHVFDRQHKIELAYNYHLKYILLKEAIDGDEHQRKIATADWIEKFNQQLSKVDLLDHDNKIKQQQLASESFKKWVFAAGLAVIVLLGLVFFRNLSLKRKNEKLRSEKNQSLLQNQAIDLEMRALRAQMNPHFIFNSLNSINRFILQNNKAEASGYLTKFSRLIRLILQNSQASLITLENELESMELYLDLEAVRFNHHFDYKIIVQPDLETAAILVPPLMIQPYVENAIWHGLMHKEEKGLLEVEVGIEGDALLLRITDDGIGRKQASALASKTATKNKSLGLKITADRIAMLQSPGKRSSVTITDLTHPDGSAAGTEVIITIPAIYD